MVIVVSCWHTGLRPRCGGNEHFGGDATMKDANGAAEGIENVETGAVSLQNSHWSASHWLWKPAERQPNPD
jgi:hypothetical protein